MVSVYNADAGEQNSAIAKEFDKLSQAELQFNREGVNKSKAGEFKPTRAIVFYPNAPPQCTQLCGYALGAEVETRRRKTSYTCEANYERIP